ncbi:uncharacterized [Tachysurus ichikawai]
MGASRSDGEEELGLKVCYSGRGVKYEVLFAWKMSDTHGLALMSVRLVLREMKLRAVNKRSWSRDRVREVKHCNLIRSHRVND